MTSDEMPPPLRAVTGAEAMAASAFQDQTARSPLGAAAQWWVALNDPDANREILDHLSLHPEVWGDYYYTAGVFASLAIMSNVIPNPDRSDVAYVKFVPYEGETGAAQAFADTTLPDVWLLTMVWLEDIEEWRVWGASHNYVPTVADIFEAP